MNKPLYPIQLTKVFLFLLNCALLAKSKQNIFLFFSQLKVSLFLISFDSPLTFKERITKLSTLHLFDEFRDILYFN